MFVELTQPMIIAEIGINHDGHLSKAKELIHAAHACGASYAKFQSFQVDSLVSKTSPTPTYQLQRLNKTQYEILKSLEFTFAQQEELFSYAKSIGIPLFATPFDTASLKFLVEEMNVPLIKVSSGDIDNSYLLYLIGATELPTILSTGASTLKDIDYALTILEYGRKGGEVPKRLWSHSKMPRVDSLKREQICLLHCTSQYPAPFEDLNLNSITFLEKRYEIPIGLSDHSLGIEACIAAVALGAKVIEKHLTLDRDDQGPDHFASLNPSSFSDLVLSIRNIQKAIGKPTKRITNSEIKNKDLVRRSVYAARDILEGTIIEDSDLIMLRPQVIDSHPHEFWELIGTVAKRNFLKGENVRNI